MQHFSVSFAWLGRVQTQKEPFFSLIFYLGRAAKLHSFKASYPSFKIKASTSVRKVEDQHKKVKWGFFLHCLIFSKHYTGDNNPLIRCIICWTTTQRPQFIQTPWTLNCPIFFFFHLLSCKNISSVVLQLSPYLSGKKNNRLKLAVPATYTESITHANPWVRAHSHDWGTRTATSSTSASSHRHLPHANQPSLSCWRAWSCCCCLAASDWLLDFGTWMPPLPSLAALIYWTMAAKANRVAVLFCPTLSHILFSKAIWRVYVTTQMETMSSLLTFRNLLCYGAHVKCLPCL